MSWGCSTTPTEIICRMTAARFVRRISGSVYSGRDSKSSSEYNRMHTPSDVRPERPARCRADAWEMRSMGRRWTLVRAEYREIRAVPGSITYLMPGTVSEVSATLVASTIRRCEDGANTRFCSAMDSRPNSGRIWVPARERCESMTLCSASWASRISRSPAKNTRMSPRGSRESSTTASHTASIGSRSSSTSPSPVLSSSSSPSPLRSWASGR